MLGQDLGDNIAGEFHNFRCAYGYLIGRCGADVLVGITDSGEVLLDLRVPGGIISLGFVEDAPMPPEDDAEHDAFDWGEWSDKLRRHIIEEGLA